MKYQNPFKTLKKREWAIRIGSLVLITAAFLFSSHRDYLSLVASLVGVTALIFVAKGDPLGQALTVVFAVFYFILRYFNTANLPISTVSVATSFIAASRTFLRSPLYGLGYAANDIVLIIMWIMATMEDSSYLPMIVCFSVFFINDCYGFLNWQRIRQRQSGSSDTAETQE